MVQKLRVDVGHKEAHEKIYHYRQHLDVDRWTHENRQIVECYKDDSFDEYLLQRFKVIWVGGKMHCDFSRVNKILSGL